MKENNPSYTFNFFSFDESGAPIPCDTTQLALVFPNITTEYDNQTCKIDLWVQNVTNFFINTGRFYTKGKFFINYKW
jgi:hypothetical protein